ncbi:MAG: hypothetical protein V4805_13935, partial [Pseudomonadota bacterium]
MATNIMSISIHPSARKSFDEKASGLLSLIKESRNQLSTPNSFPSEILPTANITQKDIAGDLEGFCKDLQGNTIARIFHFNGKRYELDFEGYKFLKALADRIYDIWDIKQKLSISYIEDKIFSWIKDVFILGGTQNSFCEFLIYVSERDIKFTTVWIP